MGRTRWILILCAWTMVGLLFAVRRIVLVKVMGTHVSWVIVGALELVYWYVWAAYTPLVIGLAKRFPLTGPRFVPHIAIHTITSLMMAPLAAATEYFLSSGLLRTASPITDPGALRLLPPFEGHAQQVAEADQQMARGIDVFLHQDSNGVKSVEQKVRM